MVYFVFRHNVYVGLIQGTMLTKALPTHYVCAGMDFQPFPSVWKNTRHLQCPFPMDILKDSPFCAQIPAENVSLLYPIKL